MVFNHKYNEIEEELLKQFIDTINQEIKIVYGTSATNEELQKLLLNIEQIAEHVLDETIEDSKKAGTYNMRINFEDWAESEEGKEKINERFEKKKNEGVTEEDICWWLSLTDLERRFRIKSDDAILRAFLTGFFIKYKDAGLSEEEAKTKALQQADRVFPLYGDPSYKSYAKGEDRPLPFELSGRINDFQHQLALRPSEEIKTTIEENRKKIQSYSSFNAFIRDEIRKGHL